MKNPRDYVPATPAVLATVALVIRPSYPLAVAVVVLGALAGLALWLEARDSSLAERVGALEPLTDRVGALEVAAQKTKDDLARVNNAVQARR